MKKSRKKPALYVGTSGWVYKSWHTMFYPKEIKKDFLKFYGTEFSTVEINTSFYHLPKKTTFEKWRKETPKDFVFSIKLSRYITHIERLKNSKRALKLFFSMATGLQKKAAIVLIQLPPSLKFEKNVFLKFIKDLDASRTIDAKKVRIALEPRHDSWFDAENLDVIRSAFRKCEMALVFAHSSIFPRYEPIKENILANYIYVRFHGPKEFALSQYGKRRLKPWAKFIREWLDKGLTVFVYFNDDAHGYAVKDARILKELLSDHLPS